MPADVEREMLIPQGAAFGPRANLLASLLLRPKTRSPIVDGLYLAGASTRLGGWLPQVIASGMVAAEMILDEPSAEA